MSADLPRAFREDVTASGDCPAPEVLWDSARGALPRGADHEVLLHLAACGACAAAWRVAREMGAPAAVPRRVLVLPVAAAAVLLAAMGLGAWWLQRRSTEPAYRDPGAPAIVARSAERLPRDSVLLRWHGGPDGTTYDLRITTEDLALLAEVRLLERPEHAVAAGTLAGVPPGEAILWQVTARWPDGRRVESPTFRLVLD